MYYSIRFFTLIKPLIRQKFVQIETYNKGRTIQGCCVTILYTSPRKKRFVYTQRIFSPVYPL